MCRYRHTETEGDELISKYIWGEKERERSVTAISFGGYRGIEPTPSQMGVGPASSALDRATVSPGEMRVAGKEPPCAHLKVNTVRPYRPVFEDNS